MNSLSCKLNLPLGPSLRDPALEADLQARLDDGHRIFAIGDVHGHLATFRALLHRLDLKPEDRVVCLGDMIDRGPNSAGVVALIRTHPQIICLKGNHEHMAVQSVQPDGTFEAWQPWMKRGGKSTYASYIVQSNGDLYKAKDRMLDDFMWLDTLPTQLVLDHTRLVHAGYDPRMPIDMQGEKELLWIRKEWYQHEGAVDPSRTVFFGHTTTTKLADAAGAVAFSSNQLADGRPAWVGLDVGAYNHVSPNLAAIDIATFRIVQQPTLRCDRWFERINTRSKQKGKKKTWKGQENLREAEIARSFGLKALATRAKQNSRSTLRAQRALEEVGVVFPPELNGTSIGGYRIYRMSTMADREMEKLRGPTSFRVYRKSTPLHGDNTRPSRRVSLV